MDAWFLIKISYDLATGEMRLVKRNDEIENHNQFVIASKSERHLAAGYEILG